MALCYWLLFIKIFADLVPSKLEYTLCKQGFIWSQAVSRWTVFDTGDLLPRKLENTICKQGSIWSQAVSRWTTFGNPDPMWTLDKWIRWSFKPAYYLDLNPPPSMPDLPQHWGCWGTGVNASISIHHTDIIPDVQEHFTKTVYFDLKTLMVKN